jgi:hypothetical protein
MSIDYGYINKWLSEREITVQSSFTEQLKIYVDPFGKKMI